MPQEGAISVNRGRRWIIEDCTVRDVNAVGIDAGRRDPRMTWPEAFGGHRIRRNAVRRCGICGIAGLGMFDAVIEDNLVEDCCTHDVEPRWESAGIKTHNNRRTLVRRNLVRRIRFGSGIWLDFTNHDSRCTQNVIHDGRGMFGGIFIEASHAPNRVDHNVVFNLRAVSETEGGHGLHAHDTSDLSVDHNLFADCDGSAVHLPKGQADRFAEGRGSVSRRHTIEDNLIIDCGRAIALDNADSTCDRNAYAGLRKPGPFRLDDVDEWLDLDSWQRFHGLDTASAMHELALATDREGLRLTGERPTDRGPAWAIAPDGRIAADPRT